MLFKHFKKLSSFVLMAFASTVMPFSSFAIDLDMTPTNGTATNTGPAYTTGAAEVAAARQKQQIDTLNTPQQMGSANPTSMATDTFVLPPAEPINPAALNPFLAAPPPAEAPAPAPAPANADDAAPAEQPNPANENAPDAEPNQPLPHPDGTFTLPPFAEDRDGDGIIDHGVITETWLNGKLVKRVTILKDSEGGKPTERHVREWNEYGDLTFASEERENTSDDPDNPRYEYSETIENRYDANGALVWTRKTINGVVRFEANFYPPDPGTPISDESAPAETPFVQSSYQYNANGVLMMSIVNDPEGNVTASFQFNPDGTYETFTATYLPAYSGVIHHMTPLDPANHAAGYYADEITEENDQGSTVTTYNSKGDITGILKFDKDDNLLPPAPAGPIS